ncbi:MAG: protein phosphatase 2C domain-containing protein [Bifidobacteriaceae bacterium]|jgi:protein phosphatase|nr:protein phosphatase 2C domain-containing protein [Bifidobacteriaceae bacterium]
MHFITSAISDIGLTRTSNQDSAYISDKFILVADGMGGYVGGDLASRIVVDFLSKLDHSNITDHNKVKQNIEQILQNAKETFGKLIIENPNLNMMGSTITFLVLVENKILLGHVGDSRAYKFSNKKLVQLSHDHTVVQQLVDSGKLTLKKAKNNDSRHQLTRVFGFFDIETNPDIELLDCKVGDRYILCSDGLSAFVSDKVIEKTLGRFQDDDQASQKLVELAMRNGSTDNITVVVASVFADEAQNREKQKLGSAAQKPDQENPANKTSGSDEMIDKEDEQRANKKKVHNEKSKSKYTESRSTNKKLIAKPFWSIFK